MSTTLMALIGYALWMITLTLIIVLIRGWLSLSGKKKANTFSPLGDDISHFNQRLCRAHANCYENLPIAAVIMFSAVISGNTHLTDSLAWIFLAARVMQSLMHLLSGELLAVYARFSFFLTQIIILSYWGMRILGFTSF